MAFDSSKSSILFPHLSLSWHGARVAGSRYIAGLTREDRDIGRADSQAGEATAIRWPPELQGRGSPRRGLSGAAIRHPGRHGAHRRQRHPRYEAAP